jgi:hypothetical protein
MLWISLTGRVGLLDEVTEEEDGRVQEGVRQSLVNNAEKERLL